MYELKIIKGHLSKAKNLSTGSIYFNRGLPFLNSEELKIDTVKNVGISMIKNDKLYVNFLFDSNTDSGINIQFSQSEYNQLFCACLEESLSHQTKMSCNTRPKKTCYYSHLLSVGLFLQFPIIVFIHIN